MNLNLALVILKYWFYFILTLTFDIITGPLVQPYCLQFVSKITSLGHPELAQ